MTHQVQTNINKERPLYNAHGRLTTKTGNYLDFEPCNEELRQRGQRDSSFSVQGVLFEVDRTKSAVTLLRTHKHT